MRKKKVYHGMKGERIVVPSEGAKKLKSPTPLTNVRYNGMKYEYSKRLDLLVAALVCFGIAAICLYIIIGG